MKSLTIEYIDEMIKKTNKQPRRLKHYEVMKADLLAKQKKAKVKKEKKEKGEK